MSGEIHSNHTPLTQPDCQAIDALCDANWCCKTALSRVSSEISPRCEVVSTLLENLNTPAACDEHRSCPVKMATRTMQAIAGLKLGGHAPVWHNESVDELSGEHQYATLDELEGLDEDAFESLVANEFDSRRVPGAMRERAFAFETLLRQLETPVAAMSDESPSRLVSATLAAISAAELQSQRRRTVHAASRAPSALPRGLRVGNAAAVAASLLIAGSIALPVFSAVRDRTRQVACAANFGVIGSAMNAYAMSNRSHLPMASAGFGWVSDQASTASVDTSNLTPWWNVGKDGQSNSQHMFKLASEQYVTMDQLACPGNAGACRTMQPGLSDWMCFDEVSFSMQLMCPTSAKQWKQTPDKPLMADRNPAVVKAWVGQPIDPLENSRNHQGKGQWILLYDGSAVWNMTAASGTDLIWVPRSYESMMKTASNPRRMAPLTGRERPSGVGEVFLVP